MRSEVLALSWPAGGEEGRISGGAQVGRRPVGFQMRGIVALTSIGKAG